MEYALNKNYLTPTPDDCVANFQLELRTLINNGKILQAGSLNKALTVS